jgi:hypothetical protein
MSVSDNDEWSDEIEYIEQEPYIVELPSRKPHWPHKIPTLKDSRQKDLPKPGTLNLRQQKELSGAALRHNLVRRT